jgi:hypothetical protein
MRRLLRIAALAITPILALAPKFALADETISGQWRADQGHGVLINMDVLADGHWFSQTIQNDKVVAELAGTYEQTPKNDAAGRIVFTPLKSKVTAEHGAAKVEEDTYTLTQGGKVLTLSTDKESMVFRNTTAP